MDWPACSPDLNPIENLWAWIKMQVNLRSPKTFGELEKVVNQVWESISIEFLRPYWQSMKKRVVLVNKSKGQRLSTRGYYSLVMSVLYVV